MSNSFLLDGLQPCGLVEHKTSFSDFSSWKSSNGKSISSLGWEGNKREKAAEGLLLDLVCNPAMQRGDGKGTANSALRKTQPLLPSFLPSDSSSSHVPGWGTERLLQGISCSERDWAMEGCLSAPESPPSTPLVFQTLSTLQPYTQICLCHSFISSPKHQGLLLTFSCPILSVHCLILQHISPSIAGARHSPPRGHQLPQIWLPTPVTHRR